MRKLNTIHGFTLIELVIVLSILSLTIVTVLGTFQLTQQRTQFRIAIEKIQTRLEQAKSEANTTLNITSPTPGTNRDRIVFGKAVDLAPTGSPGTMRIYTISADNEDTLSNIILESPVDETDIPWGVEYNTSAHRYVVFARSPADGRLITYVFANGTDLTDPAVYNTFSDTTGVFGFHDPGSSLEATIKVDSATSTIIRSYDN